jgi:hypothetical protein
MLAREMAADETLRPHVQQRIRQPLVPAVVHAGFDRPGPAVQSIHATICATNLEFLGRNWRLLIAPDFDAVYSEVSQVIVGL